MSYIFFNELLLDNVRPRLLHTYMYAQPSCRSINFNSTSSDWCAGGGFAPEGSSCHGGDHQFPVDVSDDQYGQDRYDGRDFVNIDCRINIHQLPRRRSARRTRPVPSSWNSRPVQPRTADTVRDQLRGKLDQALGGIYKDKDQRAKATEESLKTLAPQIEKAAASKDVTGIEIRMSTVEQSAGSAADIRGL